MGPRLGEEGELFIEEIDRGGRSAIHHVDHHQGTTVVFVNSGSGVFSSFFFVGPAVNLGELDRAKI